MKINKYSNYKIANFPDKLESFHNQTVTPPLYVRIKPINACNHKCFYCAYNKTFVTNMNNDMEYKDIISKEKLIEVLEDFSDMGVKAITFSGGGEPLLHPNIIDFIDKSRELEINYSIITNGQVLDGKIAESLYDASWVRISVDYSNLETFTNIRGRGEKYYNKVLDNIKNFNINKNPECNFGLNFIINEYNYKQIYSACVLFKPFVENIRFSPVWTPDFEKYHEPFKEIVIKQLEQARNEFDSPEFKVLDSYDISNTTINRKYDKCYVMQTMPVIGADAKVYTCHNKAYDNEGIIGDISNQSFKTMWNSPETAEIFKNFKASEICKHQCSNDEKNIIINEILASRGDSFV